MRYFIVIIFCITSVCLAQETYHDEDYGFTIDIPSNWYISFDDEWPDEVKSALEQHYLSKALFMLSPLGVEVPYSPCIRVFGGIGTKNTNLRTTYVEKNGKRMLTSKMKSMIDELLEGDVKQYHEIDTYYDYDSSKYLAIAKTLYKHNEESTYFMVTSAKFIGQPQGIDFQGYWAGIEHEEFWQVFSEVVDSYRFGQVSEVVDSLKFGTEPKSKEEVVNQIWKWGGIILTISIILGFTKKLLGR